MTKFSIEDLQKHFKCKDLSHKCIVSELVYLLVSHPSNIVNSVSVNKYDLRKLIYGDEYGTALEKSLELSGYWSNDLACIFADAVGFEGNVFSELNRLLGGVEIMEGVVVKKL